MTDFFSTELQILEVMLIVSAVAIAVRRIRLPYTVALVLAGLALAIWGQLELELTPGLVLGVFVPPLIFDAAFHLQWRDLRSDIWPIVALAVPGVLLNTLAVGGLLTLLGVLPLPVALVFGALIAATDPVAVVATFRAVGAPRRLTTLMEGESLFNDGTAVVLFGLVGALASVNESAPTLIEGVLNFAIASTGGVLVGLVLGYVVAQVIARIDDYLIEITLTTILAYGSFLLAQEIFHVSGVLAIVAAGLINGGLGTRGMSPTTRIVLFNFWEYIAFLANSFIFILIGISVEFNELVQFLVPALIAVAVVLLARAATVYLIGSIVRIFEPDLHTNYLHVLVWGGLRGAISLALALEAELFLNREDGRQVLAMTFAVVLFTLLLQATTLPTLLSRLGFTRRATGSVEYERLQGELLAVRAASRHLSRLYREGGLITVARDEVQGELDEREDWLNQALETLLDERPQLKVEIVSLVRLETLRAERSALDELAREGLLGEEAAGELGAKIDEAIEELESGTIVTESLEMPLNRTV